jgi:hypothetical protein
MNRFEITEAYLPGADGKLGWEPARAKGSKRVFVDAQTAMIARDLACRFFAVSLNQVRIELMKDPATATGVTLVVGEMGVVNAKDVGAPEVSRGPTGIAQWPRVTPFHSAFASVVVRANDMTDDELRAEVVQLLNRHPKKKAKR